MTPTRQQLGPPPTSEGLEKVSNNDRVGYLSPSLIWFVPLNKFLPFHQLQYSYRLHTWKICSVPTLLKRKPQSTLLYFCYTYKNKPNDFMHFVLYIVCEL